MTQPLSTDGLREDLDNILYSLEAEVMGDLERVLKGKDSGIELGRNNIDSADRAADAILALFNKHVQAARQEPVGDAIEIKVPAKTMQFVLSKCKQTDKTIARRLMVAEWCVDDWRKNGGELHIWKLRILASLTRRYNWTVFLLTPENLIKGLLHPQDSKTPTNLTENE
jgi:hypothetical protein